MMVGLQRAGWIKKIARCLVHVANPNAALNQCPPKLAHVLALRSGWRGVCTGRPGLFRQLQPRPLLSPRQAAASALPHSPRRRGFAKHKKPPAVPVPAFYTALGVPHCLSLTVHCWPLPFNTVSLPFIGHALPSCCPPGALQRITAGD